MNSVGDFMVDQARIIVTHLRGGQGGVVERIDCHYVGMTASAIDVEVEVKEVFVKGGIRYVRNRRARRLLNLQYVTSIDEWYEKSTV